MKLNHFIGLFALLVVAFIGFQSFDAPDRSYSGLYQEVNENLTVSDGDILWSGRFEKDVDIQFTVAIDSASSIIVEESTMDGVGWYTTDTMTPTAAASDNYTLTGADAYVRIRASITGTTKDVDFGIKITDAQ